MGQNSESLSFHTCGVNKNNNKYVRKKTGFIGILRYRCIVVCDHVVLTVIKFNILWYTSRNRGLTHYHLLQ